MPTYGIVEYMNRILYIIVPCFNEELVIPETSTLLKHKLLSLITNKQIAKKSRIIFIDDGSTDNTWQLLDALYKTDPLVFGAIKLSRNHGHQNALLAGLMSTRKLADITISIDADLQDDIDAIDKMLDAHANGAEIVYGVRSTRKHDSIFKRATAHVFYRLMHSLGTESIHNHADFRLLSRQVLNELDNFNEVNLFLRGIIPLLGFSSTTVLYERKNRLAGTSKYPLRAMVRFALDGITSFSIRPLRVITVLGFVVSLLSIGIACYSVAMYLLGQTVQGWTFTILSVWFMGGVQMICLGLIGEYVGKIYRETKGRPRYIIEASSLDR